MIAKNVIESINNPKDKSIHLILNDIKKESYEDLVKNLEPDGDRILCHNEDAQDVISFVDKICLL